MRLLQLSPDGTEESALDFHPIITVVSGLGAAGREAVIRAVTAIARGQDPGISGLLEAHGVLLDLNTDTLSMLDLHTDLDVLLRAEDMPTSSNGSAPPATNRMSVEQFLKDARPGQYPQLDEARKGQADAAEALAVLREAAERSRNEHRQAVRRLERALEEVERANAAFEAAQAGAASDEPASIGMTEAELDERRAALVERIEQLRSEVDRIDRALMEISAIDTRPIQVLLDAIRNPEPVEMVPSERAQVLADEFVRLRAETDALEKRLAAEGLDAAAAIQRLDEARAELQQAERGMARPDVSPEDAAGLEAAHEEVLEAERRASSRFNRSGKKQLEEALAKQQAILDRVGFPTWSAYVMGANLLAIDPAAEERLEKARFEYEAAETNWIQISEAIQQNPEHASLLDQLEAVYLEAFDLLGGEEPDDLEAALRAHREPKREVTTEELVDALAYQLELVGLDLGEAPSLDRTVVAAEAFLAEAATLNERVDELEEQRRQAVTALEDAEREFQSLPLTVPEGDVIDLTAAAPQVTAEDVAALDAALAEAAQREREAADVLEAREALVDAATQVHAVATSKLMKIAGDLAERHATDLPPVSEPAFEVPAGEGDRAEHEALEFYLLARLAALRNVSYAGSVPLVVDDAFSQLPPDHVRDLLLKLERMADAVQIIYLTNDEAATNWALDVGFQRAAVVQATGPFQ